MWANFFIDAIKVGRRKIIVAFNVSQENAMIAGQRVYNCEP